MKSINAPEVDMLAVSKSSQISRSAITGIAPKIGLRIIDYGRLADIDSFYTECQDYRDFYRDPNNKLNKPEAFIRPFGRCGRTNSNKNNELLQLPIIWQREYQPIVYPIDYGHGLHVGERISLSGHYNSLACFKYKQ